MRRCWDLLVCSPWRRLRGVLTGVFNNLTSGSGGTDTDLLTLVSSEQDSGEWHEAELEILVGYQESFSPRGCSGTGTGSLGKWWQLQHWQFRRCLANTVIPMVWFSGCPMQRQHRTPYAKNPDSIDLMGPFRLSIIYDLGTLRLLC